MYCKFVLYDFVMDENENGWWAWDVDGQGREPFKLLTGLSNVTGVKSHFAQIQF